MVFVRLFLHAFARCLPVLSQKRKTHKTEFWCKAHYKTLLDLHAHPLPRLQGGEGVGEVGEREGGLGQSSSIVDGGGEKGETGKSDERERDDMQQEGDL